jgi:hypothetical protein
MREVKEALVAATVVVGVLVAKGAEFIVSFRTAYTMLGFSLIVRNSIITNGIRLK